MRHRDNDFVKEFAGPPDHIEVPVGYWIETTRINCAVHRRTKSDIKAQTSNPVAAAKHLRGGRIATRHEIVALFYGRATVLQDHRGGEHVFAPFHSGPL